MLLVRHLLFGMSDAGVNEGVAVELPRAAGARPSASSPAFSNSASALIDEGSMAQRLLCI